MSTILPVHIKQYRQRRTAAYYYDLLAFRHPVQWRRGDICLENTTCRRSKLGPLPPTKKKYQDLVDWVDDPHQDVFKDVKLLVGDRKTWQ